MFGIIEENRFRVKAVNHLSIFSGVLWNLEQTVHYTWPWIIHL